jgi:16S rRNA (guanine966-N2)-methyltransferase
MAEKSRSNTVRIIGGKYRARKLNFPDLPTLRPTPDRVRETLFNWLMHDVYGASVLDAFSGSGALGIEALSRGAERVVFIEQDRKAFSAIQENLNGFKIPPSSYQLHQGDALNYLKSLNAGYSERATGAVQFDLIFLDPPFGQGWLAKCLPYCLEALSPAGKIYIEQESSLDPKSYLPEEVSILKEKTTGEVTYLLLKSER